MTYWKQRALDSIGRMESAVNGALPELVKSFEDARQELQKEIDAFYGRYARNNAITLEEAQKALSLSELQEFKGNLKEYEKLARDSIGTFNLQVDNLSVKARITRLQALETQCDAVLQKLYQTQRRLVERTVTDVFTEEYYRSQFAIEQYTGFQFQFSAPATAVIQRVLKEPVQGADISTRLWRQDIDAGFRIRQTLNQMFTTGKPPQYFAEELQKAIGAVRTNPDGTPGGTGKKYEAYRLLYNESAYASGRANLEAYKADGLDEYEVIATLDFKTSDICREQDSKHYPVDQAVTGETFPPFHVNCRTTTAPYIPDLENIKSTRMARDPETGKSVRVEKQSYRDWRKGLDEKHSVAREAHDRMQKAGLKRVPDIDTFLKQRYNNSPTYQNLMRRYANITGAREWEAVEFNPQTVAGHFDNHGSGVGTSSISAYRAAALEFVNNAKGKEMITASDGVRRFYSPATNEFASVYPDGTISTYYKPRHGERYWKGQVKKYGAGKE